MKRGKAEHGRLFLIGISGEQAQGRLSRKFCGRNNGAWLIMEQKGAMGDLAFAQEYLCKVMDDDSAKDIQGRTLERTWTLILNCHTLRIMAVGM